jgi:hypothetical protein
MQYRICTSVTGSSENTIKYNKEQYKMQYDSNVSVGLKAYELCGALSCNNKGNFLAVHAM